MLNSKKKDTKYPIYLEHYEKTTNVTIIGTEKREETHDLAQKIFSAKS